ncbi:MAG: hypothetical protein HC837_12425 [Chloroflexaceae bacterium]|nr:hypothetical protein [Chloroflexaceae bacterium]
MVQYKRIFLVLSVLLLVFAGALVTWPAQAQQRLICFNEVPYCIQGEIMEYWEANGGLPVFGFPTNDLRIEQIEDWTGPTQWFERDRLEDHSNEGLGVLAGRLGALLLEMQDTPWESFTRVPSAAAGCAYFPETQHSLCEPFLSYWRNNGGLPRFGYPITEPFIDTIQTDAGEWTGLIQYFERRRMEYHTELPGDPVLLGLLGNEIRAMQDTPPDGTPTVTPTAPPDDGDPTPTPTTEPDIDNTRIAFVSTRNGNHEIFVMDADGRNQQNLTNSLAKDRQPDWSPDGRRIAFVSDRDGSNDIHVMDADGSNQTRLTTDPSDNTYPSWSPDGERILFQSDRDGNEEIYVMNADGSAQTRLSQHPANDRDPSWSSDGTRILFRSDRDGSNNILVMNTDGSGQQRLTNDQFDNRAPVWSPWSPRTPLIAFQSDRDGNTDVYLMNTDGSNLVRLTNNLAIDGSPDWSPNAEKIVFETGRDGNSEIYVMNADGSAPTNLSQNPSDDYDPSWSP